MTFQQEIASQINELASAKCITAYAVAKATGVSVNTVYSVFNGTGNPSLKTVQAVYDYLILQGKKQ